MPNPTRRPHSAASRANLKRGGSPGRPKETGETREARRISRKLLLNPQYQTKLRRKLHDGSIHPSVEVMLWYYGFGKPKETIETTPPAPVRIVHEYAKE